MARALTAGAAAEIAAAALRPVVFYEGEFSTGTLRLWSGIGPIDWDGETWTGAGRVLNVAPIQETSDIAAVAFEVSLSGEASDIIAINLNAARNGMAGRVWLGFLDASGDLIADPFKAFEGRFDVPEINDAGETAAITARYESRLIDLDRSRIRRYTSEDQKQDYADDLGFDFVPSLQEAGLPWGVGLGGVVQQPGSPYVGIPSKIRDKLPIIGQFFPDISDWF